MRHPPITLIGAGLVGALLAQQLAQRGIPVDVFEKRADPRRETMAAGRSINLALAERGLGALRRSALKDQVLQSAVMMRGRMVHEPGGHSALQRYGLDDSEVIWSVSRQALNTLLLDAAETAGARFHFGQTLVDADFPQRRMRVADAAGTERETDASTLVGADGAGSTLRSIMNRGDALGARVETLGHGYKELGIPSARSAAWGSAPAPAPVHGDFVLEPNALHIWPRGNYMCIALPNIDGSFTVTLFLTTTGRAPSFATIPDAPSARKFFAEQFPDLLALLPDFADDFSRHPVGTLSTLHLQRWHLDGSAVLIGDAAHAMAPFYGQGMNCGFEDVAMLGDLLAAEPHDRAGVFAEFQRQRRADTDAIAALTLDNYIEMRDSVVDPHYLLKRELSARLTALAPEHYMTCYRMVSFSDLPYAYARERSQAQDSVLEEFLHGAHAIGDVDVQAVVGALRARLPPLPTRAHG